MNLDYRQGKISVCILTSLTTVFGNWGGGLDQTAREFILFIYLFIYLFIGPTFMVGAVKSRINKIERQCHKTNKR